MGAMHLISNILPASSSMSSSSWLGALNSNALIESSNNFLDTIVTMLTSLLRNIVYTVWEFIVTVVYLVAKWLLTIVDFVFIFVRQMIGMNSDFSTIEELTGQDLIFKFLFNDTVIRVIKAMLGFSLVLLILFCIVAIFKSEYDFATTGGSNSKKQVMVRGLKSLFLMLLVPMIAIGGIVMSNVILKSLYIATSGGTQETTLGTQIFVASSYNANAYRYYADKNLKIPITYQFATVPASENNTTGWGSDGGVADLDEALRAFRSSPVWNQEFTTFLMFYTEVFPSMTEVDLLDQRAAANGEESSYHSTFDRGLYTKRSEYYTMADVLDYAVTTGNKIYVKTAEEVYKSYHSVYDDARIDQKDPSAKSKQMSTYMPIHPVSGVGGEVVSYDFDVQYVGEETITQYSHKAGTTDEANGSVFVVALEKQLTLSDGSVYPYLYPLLSTEDNFATDYIYTSRQPVVARGMFDSGRYPTAIKEVDGQTKFYRDDLNIPSMVDFFPTISYELPEGKTEDLGRVILRYGVQFITGVDINDFVPYVYYSFDLFSLFQKKTYNIVSLPEGMFQVEYTFANHTIDMKNVYRMGAFNVFIVIFMSIIIVSMLLKFVFGLARRVLDITLLAITYPAVLSTYPIDGGTRFGGWVKSFITKVLSIYGVVIGINLVLLVMPTIFSINVITPDVIANAVSLHTLPWTYTAMFANKIVQLMFTLVAFSSIGAFSSVIDSILVNEPEDSLVQTGGKMINDMKKPIEVVGSIVSGKAFLDLGKSATGLMGRFIPGSAFAKRKHEKEEQQDERERHFAQTESEIQEATDVLTGKRPPP